MKVYTFEKGKKIFEFYSIRRAFEKALEIAKETNEQIFITAMHKPSYKQDWYTVHPDGQIVTDLKNYKADN